MLVSSFMVLIILMQRPRSEGLGAAFGGGMTESVFGAQAGNVLSKLTVWCASFFFAITLGLTMIGSHSADNSQIKKEIEAAAAQSAAAAAAAAPATPAPDAAPAPGTPAAPAAPAPAPQATAPAAETTKPEAAPQPAKTASPTAPAKPAKTAPEKK